MLVVLGICTILKRTCLLLNSTKGKPEIFLAMGCCDVLVESTFSGEMSVAHVALEEAHRREGGGREGGHLKYGKVASWRRGTTSDTEKEQGREEEVMLGAGDQGNNSNVC